MRAALLALLLAACAPVAVEDTCACRVVARDAGTWVVLDDGTWAFMAEGAEFGCFWAQGFDPCAELGVCP